MTPEAITAAIRLGARVIPPKGVEFYLINKTFRYAVQHHDNTNLFMRCILTPYGITTSNCKSSISIAYFLHRATVLYVPFNSLPFEEWPIYGLVCRG